MTRIVPLIALVMLLGAHHAFAESLAASALHHEHRIRTSDVRLQSIVDEGIRLSTTFHDLVERVDRSDVIVYVETDHFPPGGFDGRLSFISSHCGTRYVRVRVVYLSDRARQIALVGHELRHAVEVAETPAIVDRPSMEHEYERLGYETSRGWRGRMFDTSAAIDAGSRVLRELRSSRGE